MSSKDLHAPTKPRDVLAEADQACRMRALRALLRFHEPGRTPFRRITPAMADDLLRWAATLPDEEILDMRGIGPTTLRWIRDNQPQLSRFDARMGMTEPRDVLAAALFETQHERLHGGADGMGLGSHEADADAILAAMPDHTLVRKRDLETLLAVEAEAASSEGVQLVSSAELERLRAVCNRVIEEYDKTHLTHDVGYEDVAAEIDQLRLVLLGRNHPGLRPEYAPAPAEETP